jgi:hypothetical protein
MADQIIDGTGSGSRLRVDSNNQIHTFSLTRSNTQDAVRKGNAYNINTGLIGLTSATESAVLYFKNDESPVNGESSFVVDAIAIGIDDEGTTTGMSLITIIKNPTAGTIVDGATAVDMSANRNFGSSASLSTTTLVYKGAEGNTFTNGEDFAQFMQQPGTRGYYTIDIEVPRGSSIGVKIDTDTSVGTTNVYVALIGHRVDGNNES